MIRNALQRFMYGRYGNDQLNMVLVLLSLALYLVFAVTSWTVLYAVSFMLMAVFHEIFLISHHILIL